MDHIGPVIIGLPLFGLLVMTVLPGRWQTASVWLLVSYVGIPAGFVILALVIRFPLLLFFAIFLAGVLAS